MVNAGAPFEVPAYEYVTSFSECEAVEPRSECAHWYRYCNYHLDHPWYYILRLTPASLLQCTDLADNTQLEPAKSDDLLTSVSRPTPQPRRPSAARVRAPTPSAATTASWYTAASVYVPFRRAKARSDTRVKGAGRKCWQSKRRIWMPASLSSHRQATERCNGRVGQVKIAPRRDGPAPFCGMLGTELEVEQVHLLCGVLLRSGAPRGLRRAC